MHSKLNPLDNKEHDGNGYIIVMRRPVLMIVSAVSLVMCVLAFVMWVRSDDRRSAVRMNWRGNACAIFSERGRVGVDNSPAIDDFALERKRAMVLELAEQQHLMEYLQRTGERSLISSFAPNPRWRNSTATPPVLVRYAVPYWVLILVLLVLPVVWLMDYWRSLVRMSWGLCAGCGYDLRGITSGACPECGRKTRMVTQPCSRPSS